MENKTDTKIKITVLKVLYHTDLVNEYLHPKEKSKHGPCEFHHVGQEFIIEGYEKPDGFCSWAWADIHREFIAVKTNGNFTNFKDEGVVIASCTDGVRPVIFKVERL